MKNESNRSQRPTKPLIAFYDKDGNLLGKEYGEWFRTVLEDGTPRYKEPKASMWNCPYHNSRMGFEIDTRLK